jgi:hypothetical protein
VIVSVMAVPSRPSAVRLESEYENAPNLLARESKARGSEGHMGVLPRLVAESPQPVVTVLYPAALTAA